MGRQGRLTLWKAILLGIVQGLTEFLPVSSSGHLSFMQHILKINTDTGLLFDVLLHLGTLIAIFIVFWSDIKQLLVEGISILADVITNLVRMVQSLVGGKKKPYQKIMTTPYRRFVILILISTIPTGILGVLLENIIETTITTVLVPGMCLILTGVLLIMADHYEGGTKTEADTSFKDAIFLGVSQGIATIPGLSRSGTTITACLSRGFERSYAVRYSFIMSIPAVLGAVILEVKDITAETLTKMELCNYLVGMAVAAVIGYFCIKTMLVLIRGKKFTYFAIYCFIVGAMAVISNFLSV